VEEIMTLKLTGERVYVLSDEVVDGEVSVRRPSMGPNGITHAIEIFGVRELEPLEANIRREIGEVLLKNQISQEIMQRESAKSQAGEIKKIDIN